MRFEPGDRVQTRTQAAKGHTRLPNYLQRRVGRIVNFIGEYPFADDRARNAATARNEALYTVEFNEGGHTVRADLFEPYLEAIQ